ncbi:MAG: hypothetical protein K8R99_01305 [Actinomycetia bacterium]|nr:hypothetical protein [Actinomycetes bacterium]
MSSADTEGDPSIVEPQQEAVSPAESVAGDAHSDQANATTLKVWIPAARAPVIAALESAGATVLDDPEGAEYAVISTRLARHRIAEYTTHARECGLPVLVLVHPGGEEQAVTALCSGGQTAIAESDLDALRSLRGASTEPDADRIESLLKAFGARLGRGQTQEDDESRLVDPVSELPAAGALQLRSETAPSDTPQNLRIMSIAVPALEGTTWPRAGTDAHDLLHRRIANGLRLVCAGRGDLFDTGHGAFTVVATDLDVAATEDIGASIAEVVHGYQSDGQLPLAVAVGHAGPECSHDFATLRELAGRAEIAAREPDSPSVLDAAQLARPFATATGLDVTFRLAKLAAEREGVTSRDEVASVAADIATLLGIEGTQRLLVQFCAAVSDIGAAIVGDAENRVEISAAVIGPVAGPTVSAVLRSLSEHWDGSGRPDGLSGSAIPEPARIIAVAEQLVRDGYSPATLDAGSNTIFDPNVVRAAHELARQR